MNCNLNGSLVGHTMGTEEWYGRFVQELQLRTRETLNTKPWCSGKSRREINRTFLAKEENQGQ